MIISYNYRLFRKLISLFAVTVFSVCSVSFASGEFFPGDHKISDRSVINSLSAGEHQGVIVIFDDTEASAQAADMRRLHHADHDTPDIVRAKSEHYRALKAEVKREFSAQDIESLRDYSHLPAAFLKVKSLNALRRLAAHKGVKGIYRNQAFRHFLEESLPLMGQPAVAIAGHAGTGASVAVLDTGVDYTDPSFGACAANRPGDCLELPPAVQGCKIACVHDFASNDNELDDDGHGTNVSGIVAGVAPGAKIVNLDIFEQNGYAYSDKIIAAINWVIANKTAYNIVAMNMSFGGGYSTVPCGQDMFASPIASARSAGILSAVASGNERRKNAVASPACVPAAVSVGAVYDTELGSINWGICRDTVTAPDIPTCFSNSANFLTLLAPGSEITSVGWIMSGTSQAAPHVAGAVAVLRGIDAFPSETVDQTLGRLVSTGVPVTDPSNGITIPRINLSAAATGEVPVPLYSLAGIITTSGQKPVEGVKVLLSGASSSETQTDSSGKYVFNGLASGDYRVTPSKLGFGFSPASTSVRLGGGSLAAVNFTVKTYSISGTVKGSWGNLLRNVTVTVSGCDITRSVITGSRGTYTATDLPNCSYRVTPSRSGYSFSPFSRTVAVNNANVSRTDFRGK